VEYQCTVLVTKNLNLSIKNVDRRGFTMKIRLCSSSPTRAKILREFGVDFIQSSVDFDEDGLNYNEPNTFVYQASLGKLKRATELYSFEYPLLCADSVIVSEGMILRKAKSRDEAKRFLELQSNSRVKIVTAVHLKSEEFYFIDISATEYRFHKFDEYDLKIYLDSKEWQGKAGACMVERFCKKYIGSVKGYQSTAMGLQIERVLPWIGE
jgi:septum formation protein